MSGIESATRRRSSPRNPRPNTAWVAKQSRHVDRVLAAAEARELPGEDGVAASWQRSALAHRVDPASEAVPRILTQRELTDIRAPLGGIIDAARDELDRLFALIRHAGYTVLFCNSKGIVVDHRGHQADASRFRFWGSWLGAVWSEEVEGTNGIGTCIAEERPVTIHRSQHFRARHIELSCSSAPIFDWDGKLQAVLDVSSIDPDLSESSHALAGALTQATARAIEERLFRERFRREWIVAVAPVDAVDSGMLLAVNRDLRITGMDRQASKALSADEERAAATDRAFWEVFERNPTLFRERDLGDVATPLVPLGTTDTWLGLVTPPEATAQAWYNADVAAFHTRPRLDVMSRFQRPQTERRRRGGLSPATMKRVREYVDENIDKTIDLGALASVADLSLYHFARAFKQSEGTTPHCYLLQRRVERARELLIETDLPLSEVALASGFSDQSHFSRHFGRRMGVSPAAFRRSNG